jgi:glycosyltransferase involved in cell wall biosynthesis
MALFSRKARHKQTIEPWVSPEDHAASLLSMAIPESDGEHDEEITILDKDLQRKKLKEKKEKETAEANMRAGQAIVEAPRSEREKLRVLLITGEAALFMAGGTLEREYAELAEYFDELHVIVITMRKGGIYRSRRIAPNVWMYPTNSRLPLFALYDVYRIARSQVAFAAGFRADIVIATDPFEAGTAAYVISRQYNRPLQFQMSVDPFEKDYVSERAGNRWRFWAALFLVPRADCILARSKHLETVLKKRYPNLREHIRLLPPFHNLSAFRDAAPAFNLHERYAEFKFVILVVSRLDARSNTALAIDACAPFLRQYPTIGLVIVGDGPLRRGLEKKVINANLTGKVMFEAETADPVSYLKSANLFLNVAMDEEQDTMLAAAAAAGLPILTVASSMADMLFEDGVSAFVCPENDMVCLQARIGEFLNDNQLRATFSINGRDQVFSLMEQDVESYRKAYVQSFESCVLTTYTEKEK